MNGATRLRRAERVFIHSHNGLVSGRLSPTPHRRETLEVMFGRAAEQAKVSVKFSLVRRPDGDRGRGGGGRLRWSFKVTVATHLRHVCNNNNSSTEKRKKMKKMKAERNHRRRGRCRAGGSKAGDTPAHVLLRLARRRTSRRVRDATFLQPSNNRDAFQEG